MGPRSQRGKPRNKVSRGRLHLDIDANTSVELVPQASGEHVMLRIVLLGHPVGDAMLTNAQAKAVGLRLIETAEANTKGKS